MNQTIETILNHRSIRKFEDKKLTEEQVHLLVEAAQQASTSSNVMAYTIIGITDEDLKEELRKVSGQPYVKDNGHLFVFCGDLNRIHQLGSREDQQQMQQSIESTEQFIVTTVDAALAAQNMAIAAESMGLGICYLGSLRNDVYRVNELLELPDHVVPLFGLATGYPKREPEKRPRLPLQTIYHENKYNENTKQQKWIDQYDEELKAYYEARSTNKRVDTWTDQMIRKYSKASRMEVTPFIKEKNLNKQ